MYGYTISVIIIFGFDCMPHSVRRRQPFADIKYLF